MNIGNSATTGGGIRHRNGSRNFADMAADVVMAAEAVTSSSSNVSMTLAVTTAVGGGGAVWGAQDTEVGIRSGSSTFQ